MLETDRPHVLREMIYVCRPAGVLSVPGVYGGLVDKIPFGAVMNKGLTIRTGQTHVNRWTEDLLRRIEEGQIDPSFVITHTVPLEQGPEMYKVFRDKQDGCIKVVLKPGACIEEAAMDYQKGNNFPERGQAPRDVRLGWFSVGLGMAELFCARGLARFLGMAGQENLIRFYGVREIATGVGIFACKDNPSSFMWGRVAGDAIDIATLAANVSGNPRKAAIALALANVAGGVTALDVMTARRLSLMKELAAPPVRDYSDRVGLGGPPNEMRGAARSDFEMPRDMQQQPPGMRRTRCTDALADRGRARALAIDEGEEALEVDRLGEVVVEAGLARAPAVVLLAPAGDRDDEHGVAAHRADRARATS